MDGPLGIVIRVLTRNNYQSTNGNVVDATTTETTVLNRFRALHPDQAEKEFGTRFQRSYYYYLVKVSTSDEIVNMVSQVKADGGDISPFVLPEDAMGTLQKEPETERAQRQRDAALERARQDEVARRMTEALDLQRARQAEIDRRRAEALDLQRRTEALDRQRQAEALDRQRRAEALDQQRRAEALDQQRRDAERARQEAEALGQQRQAAERARQEAEALARRRQPIPANVMVLLVKARDALMAPGVLPRVAFERFISELFSFETANDIVFKSTFIDPLILILIDYDRYWSDDARTNVTDMFNILISGNTLDYLELLPNLAVILETEAEKHEQHASRQPPDPIVAVPNDQVGQNPIPCRDDVTLTNFVYHSLSCPYESMMTGLFKICGTSISRAVRFATKFHAPQSVTQQQCQTLHQSVLDVLAYLQSDVPSTRTVDSFGLRDAFIPFMKDPSRGMHDVSDLITILAQFYGLSIYADGVLVDDDANVPSAPDILLSYVDTGTPAENYGLVDYSRTMAQTRRTFKGKEYQLMACFSHKSIAHWVSYIRDANGDWFAFDGNAKRQVKVVPGMLNTTMRGVKNEEEPFVWLYVNRFDLNRSAQKAATIARVKPFVASLRRPADTFNSNPNDYWIRTMQQQLRKVGEITGFSFEADVQYAIQTYPIWRGRINSNAAVLNVIPFAPGVAPEEQRFLMAVYATVYVVKVLRDMNLGNQALRSLWLDTYRRSMTMQLMFEATWMGVQEFVRQLDDDVELRHTLDVVVREINDSIPGGLVLDAATIRTMHLKAPIISLPMARDILATVEVHPTYSSKKRGLHYQEIQADLMPVISDAYNRNADAIEASPRLKEALMPMTSNQGQLNVGRGRVEEDIRTMHWISVAADLLMAVDQKQEVDEFLLVRCLAERPVAFMTENE